jgi:excinuclease ABC subunit C
MTDQSAKPQVKQKSFDPKPFLQQLTSRPGIYQMLSINGEVLYVGKAKNLKNRVSSYFRASGLNNKTVALVARIASVEVTITNSETEALLLEHNLIKSHRPQYNILLRDDKSYPYIHVSADKYPRLSVHRGAKTGKGRYFGPYPNANAVRESMAFLQKVFQIRSCEESVFNNRTRPCLQYQIGRCTGPCVEKISVLDYAATVRHTELFLEGKSQVLTQELANKMEAASASLEFERAAELRDQLSALQSIREKQYIEGESGDLDIVAGAVHSGYICVQLMFVRAGRILGSKSFYPKIHLEESVSEILSAFLAQYYLSDGSLDIPKEILVNQPLPDDDILAQALTEKMGRKTAVTTKVRGNRSKWLALAEQTAQQNCASLMVSRDNMHKRFEALREALQLDQAPKRMECFDISHSSGELTVASCVVFNQEGPLKQDYRRFNIDGIEPGDDYAAMKQALTRRYKRLKQGEGILPDLLIIDGGKGQMTQASEVLNELSVKGVTLLGIAKGTTRKPGLEHLFIGDEQREIQLRSTSSALHLLQQIRDEAHRFAITGHKNRRDKKRRVSGLEAVPGVGPGRRRELLRYFGGLQEVNGATAEELARVPGISTKIAQTIYDALHSE